MVGDLKSEYKLMKQLNLLNLQHNNNHLLNHLCPLNHQFKLISILDLLEKTKWLKQFLLFQQLNQLIDKALKFNNLHKEMKVHKIHV